jgi:hypothetical protein
MSVYRNFRTDEVVLFLDTDITLVILSRFKWFFLSAYKNNTQKVAKVIPAENYYF